MIWSFMLNSAGFEAWSRSVFRCAGLIKQSCIHPSASQLDHGLTRELEEPRSRHWTAVPPTRVSSSLLELEFTRLGRDFDLKLRNVDGMGSFGRSIRSGAAGDRRGCGAGDSGGVSLGGGVAVRMGTDLNARSRLRQRSVHARNRRRLNSHTRLQAPRLSPSSPPNMRSMRLRCL